MNRDSEWSIYTACLSTDPFSWKLQRLYTWELNINRQFDAQADRRTWLSGVCILAPEVTAAVLMAPDHSHVKASNMEMSHALKFLHSYIQWTKPFFISWRQSATETYQKDPGNQFWSKPCTNLTSVSSIVGSCLKIASIGYRLHLIIPFCSYFFFRSNRLGGRRLGYGHMWRAGFIFCFNRMTDVPFE